MSRLRLGFLGANARPYDIFEHMDPYDDYYKLPLMNNSFEKVTGVDRLIFPMWYLCVSRFRDVLVEYISENKIDEILKYRDHYEQNILTLACSRNHPSNMPYSCGSNFEAYDAIFWLLFKALRVHFSELPKLDTFGRSVMMNCIRNEKYHYVFALLNYGFKLEVDEKQLISENKCYSHKKINDVTNCFRTFMLCEKLDKVINSDKPNGYKLLELVDECPITLNKIEHPVITSDGCVFEYSEFKKYYTEYRRSPVTRLMISDFIYHITDDKFEKLTFT